MRLFIPIAISCSLLAFTSCKKEAKVTLMTVDPGHFHAALVQKNSYPEISNDVYVYAPNGQELNEHLNKINSYNQRENNPTKWNEIVYTGDDFQEKWLNEKKGNVAVFSGDNGKKISYIKKAIENGMNVLSDKPMIINQEAFGELLRCYEIAEEKGTLLYDIMPERTDITSLIQRELAQIPAIYGTQTQGSPEEPAIIQENVHHFYKEVSGKPLTRPAWFYDVTCQGEGIVDVTTHLVDLVQFVSFANQIIDYKKDVKVYGAKRWPTKLTIPQFEKSTSLKSYPEYLHKYIKNDTLEVFANGTINYQLKGCHVKVSVAWNFIAPPGGGDTHFAYMKGTKAKLLVLQGKEQGFKPVLYIEPCNYTDNSYIQAMKESFRTIEAKYPSIKLVEQKEKSRYKVDIPQKYVVNHEERFEQVTKRFLKYLDKKYLPEWEIPNIKAKYYTTMEALKLAKK